MTQITQQDHDRTISLSVGEEVELLLAENPTTGYLWELDPTWEPVLFLVGSRFERGNGLPGAPGRRVWQFQARSPGEISLAAVSRRPSQPAPDSHTFRVGIRVAATAPAQ